MGKAIGMLETKGLIGSIEAADAMIKAADVRLVTQEKIDGALVTVLIEGDVGAVQAALEVGKEAAQRVGELISVHIIPRPDDDVAGIINQTNKNAIKKTENKQVKSLPVENKTLEGNTELKKKSK
ncbi:BMC domain-containing protein [Fictibacillus fluitans]|uniref:BMC domain-containing protein n=1 Tax=Fictibacillus fluitans TaxID=3058422 RepID=A0ABT8I0W9_9BACL|nr:BMC domain-containing protein [Fictibacillus sp. NE201]MDN4526628.1 BMC domain-containing protein [Fictibacillus sp. NE201]